MLGTINLLRGQKLVKQSTSKGNSFCTINKAYIDPIVGGWDIVCLIDEDKNDLFEKAFVPSIKFGIVTELDNNIPYEKKELNHLTNGFKTQLLFQGIIKDELKLEYREFKNDFARPAFYQNVSFDLSKGKIITFKGVQIEVIDFDNSGLTYRIIKKNNS